MFGGPPAAQAMPPRRRRRRQVAAAAAASAAAIILVVACFLAAGRALRSGRGAAHPTKGVLLNSAYLEAQAASAGDLQLPATKAVAAAAEHPPVPRTTTEQPKLAKSGAHGGRHGFRHKGTRGSRRSSKTNTRAAAATADGGNSSRCAQSLGVRKVALLFLTTRPLAHERTWHLWLWAAAGWLPQQAVAGLQETACASPAADWQAIQRACSPAQQHHQQQQRSSATEAAPPAAQLPPQHLYSVYVHAPPGFTGIGPDSIFHRHLIPQRINTSWGGMDLVAAERLLLAEALKDPLNERFLLVSDSGIPLYNPLTFYQQLMHEDRSRVKACPWDNMSKDRWREEMETPRLKQEHWRKSSQFFGLTRQHAELVAQDREVYAAFEGCTGWNSQTNVWMDTCIPDEHYIPTLLAVEGRDNETYCEGWGVVAAEWDWRDPSHPKSYSPAEVEPTLIQSQRWWCGNETQTSEDAQSMFLDLEGILGASSQQQACQLLQEVNSSSGGNSSGNSSSRGGYAHPFSGTCPMTARKYPYMTALAVRQLFLGSCPRPAAAAAGGGRNAAISLPENTTEGQQAAEQQREREQQAAAVAAVAAPPWNDLNLLGGRACRGEVQRLVLQQRPAAAPRA